MTRSTQTNSGINSLGASGEMGARVRALDWSKTSVGPMESWPQSLRGTIKTLLGSRYPMILLWGPDLIQIYNDAYTGLIGDKHPGALGRSIRETQAESWDAIGPMIHEVMSTGIPNWVPAQMLPLERAGYREESYFSLSYSAVDDDAGRITGMLCVCSEVTQQVLGERRLRLLRDVALTAGDARSVETACSALMTTMTAHQLDIPFAMIYIREQGGKQLSLRGTIGVPEDDVASARSIDIESNHEHETWKIARSARGETILLDDVDRFVTITGGPWNEPTRSVLVMPIAAAGKELPLGALVAGVSPNRALDDGYRSFYELLAAQISVTIRNAQAYEEERRRAEALAELDRAKTEFFSNVSHEFRTPLTLMLGPTEDLLAGLHGTLPSVQREQLDIAHRNALRLLKLVNTLLDFSRIQAGRAEASYEPTDLAAYVTELASAFRSVCDRAGLALSVDCQELPEPVYVDRTMWEKIVFNLLSNAFKHTFEGEIRVRLRASGDSAVLEVQDTGIGIPAEQLPHLFERFHRVAGARARTHEGSGIGLALVQELVKLHGGHVGVTSHEGVGTTFTISVPYGKAHLPPDRINAPLQHASTAVGARPFVEETLRWLPDAEETRTAPFVREPPAGRADSAALVAGSADDRTITSDTSEADRATRVLIVDDNADIREYLTRLLGKYYAIETAGDGHTALATIGARRPDLIVSDVMMPGLDGFALVSALRANPALEMVPVILLSGRAGEEATLEGLESGADDYVVKPFAARELLARVRTQLEIARVRRGAAERTRLLQEAEAARAEAEAANRSKSEFLATVSHEIRTPINAIIGYTQLLAMEIGGSLTEEQRVQLERIDASGRHLRALIEDILDLSKIEAGRLSVGSATSAAGPTVDAALDIVRPHAVAKSIALGAERKGSHEAPYRGDRQRVEQVLVNLLSNATKFTAPGGRVSVAFGTVERSVARTALAGSGPWTYFVVEDTGIGIAPAMLQQIFEPFVQGEAGYTRTHSGTGLGLTISRRLARLMNGDITVESVLGEGSRFTLWLPAG